MHLPSALNVTETILTPQQLSSLMSPYLDSGWREERFRIKQAWHAENVVRFYLTVDRYPDHWSSFHFSALQAILWLQQMGTISICHDLGMPNAAVGAVVQRDMRIRFLRPIEGVDEIMIELRLRNRKDRKGYRYYTAEFDVQQGAYIGGFSAVVKLPDSGEGQRQHNQD